MTEKRQWLARILVGGAAALGLMFLVIFLLSSISFMGAAPNYDHMQFATNKMILRFGSHVGAALVQGALVFALGAAVGVSTLPFAKEGKALLGRSLLHFALTGGLVLLINELCCLDIDPLGLLKLYVTVYFVVWGIRYIGWWFELKRLRSALGLDGKKGGTK